MGTLITWVWSPDQDIDHMGVLARSGHRSHGCGGQIGTLITWVWSPDRDIDHMGVESRA